MNPCLRLSNSSVPAGQSSGVESHSMIPSSSLLPCGGIVVALKEEFGPNHKVDLVIDTPNSGRW